MKNDLTFQAAHVTALVKKTLDDMMEFLREAAEAVKSSDVVEVACNIWAFVKDLTTPTAELAGKHYTISFIRKALALSLGAEIRVLARDPMGRACKIAIETSMLDKMEMVPAQMEAPAAA